MARSDFVASSILFASAILFFTSPAAAATNPGYSGLAPMERPVINIGDSGLAGVEVNSWNGNLVVHRPLFLVPGRGLPVELALTYNSDHHAVGGPAGFGWNLSYNIRAQADTEGNVTLVWGDGRQDKFLAAGTGFTSAPGTFITLSGSVAGEIVATTKHGLRYRFADPVHGKLTSIEDPNGNALTLAYNGQYRLVNVKDAGGRNYGLSYNTAGRLIAITDSNLAGRAWTLSYDASGRITTLTDPLGASEVFAYNAENLLVSLTDRKGRAATIAYAAATADGTRTVERIAKESSAVSFTFDRAARLTRFTDPNGFEWTYAYDAAGRIGSVQPPAGQSDVRTWDASENLLSWLDRNGHTWSAVYDASGNPTSMIDPLGQTASVVYEPALNRPTRTTDRNGNAWTFEYDGHGNRVATTDPLGNKDTLTYDSAGQPLTFTNPLAQTTRFEYDANGNLTKATDPLSFATAWNWDAASRLTKTTDPNGNSDQFAYDALDRPTSRTDPLGKSETSTWDSEGNLSSYTDRNGKSWTYAYDTLDRPVSETDPLGKTETYTYDAKGQKVSVTDRRGNTTRFTWDSRGFMTEKTVPIGRKYAFTWDDSGRLLSRNDPKGQTVAWSYDDAGRVTGRTLPGGAAATYKRDANGNVLEASEAGSKITTTFDALDRLATLSDQGLGKSVLFAYDAAGRRTKMTRPEGDEQTYSFDAAGRLTRISSTPGTFDFTYDSGDRRTSLTYPGGLGTTYAYDSNDRVTSLVTRSGATTLQSFAHQYDANGNVTKETRKDSSTSTMTWDGLSRLTREVRTGSPAYDIRYTLDERDNILTASGTPFFPTSLESFTYDAANQVTRATGTEFSGAFDVAYSYDANGNLSRKQGTGASTVTYAYDALDRLASASDSAVGSEIYSYDPLGRLASIVVAAPVAGEPGTQRYFYDERGIIIASYDAAGNVVERYWHNDVFEGGSKFCHGAAPTRPLRERITINGNHWEYHFGIEQPTNRIRRLILDGITPPCEVELEPQDPNFPKSPPDTGIPPDGYVARTDATGSIFFPVRDPKGNITGSNGSTGFKEKLYDSLGRTVVFGPVGPFGYGGHDPFRDRINSACSTGGTVQNLWDDFRMNQPNRDRVDPTGTGTGTGYRGAGRGGDIVTEDIVTGTALDEAVPSLRPTMKPCVITLSHTRPDRRVFSKLSCQ